MSSNKSSKKKNNKGETKSSEVNPPNNLSCQLCSTPDNDEMVQCDVCNLWHHFICVNVTEDIKDQPWLCTKCIKHNTEKEKFGNGGVSHHSSTTSSSRSSQQRRRNLAMMKLNEEMELQRLRDKEYLEKKYALLEMDSEEDEVESIRDTITVKPIGFNEVSSWLNQSKTDILAAGHPHHTTTKSSHKLTSSNPPQNLNNAQSITKSSWPGVGVLNQNHNMSSLHNNASLPKGASVDKQPQHFKKPTPHANVSRSSQAMQLTNVPNQSQLAARQMNMKDLPQFNGNPEDWPIFISIFESSTDACGFSNAENMVRLQRCLKGKALDTVRSRLCVPDNVAGIINTLYKAFGQPEFIIETLLQKVRNEPPIRQDRMESIINFALKVENLCATMQSANLHRYLDNPTLLRELSDKLPSNIKLNWGIYKSQFSITTIATFSTWLTEVADATRQVTWSTSLFANESKADKKISQKGFINAHGSGADETSDSKNVHISNNRSSKRKCRLCGNDCMSTEKCPKFVILDYSNRWKCVKEHQLCKRCLFHHGNRKCNRQRLCGVNGCTYKHHSLLHNPKKEVEESDVTSVPYAINHTQGICGMHRRGHNELLFRIVPVIVRANQVEIKTFAFLDDGSSITLVDEAIANEMKLTGTASTLCLKWTGNVQRREEGSRKISFEISPTSNPSRTFTMNNVHTVHNLQLPVQSINIRELCKTHHHLKGLPIESYESAMPRMLIGIDNVNLQVPLRIKECNENPSLIATKTRLGWSIYGSTRRTPNKQLIFQHSLHVCACNEESDKLLNQLVKQNYVLEDIQFKGKNLESEDDKFAREIMETTIKREGNTFHIGLLWKYPDVHLPNSLPMAQQRLKCLMRKLEKDPKLAENMAHQLREYVEKDYIRKLSQSELLEEHQRIWYLPIFPVTSPSKPNKVRIVWDAAAKVNGIALNDVLYKGPDQLNSLTYVLFKFREKAIAISGDIREMYHRIKIQSQDQQSQRFLWPNSDPSKPPDVFIMQSMTFGATCSPSCALYIKNKNALEVQNKYPRAVSAILDNHYVDDWLDSVDSESEAIQLVNEVKSIHQRANFEIRNWLSNSQLVLKALGEKNDGESKKNMNMNNELPADKVLGLWWCTSSDCFTSRQSLRFMVVYVVRLFYVLTAV